MALAPSCVFCFAELTKLNERNLVNSRGEFNVGQQLESLPFIIHTEISKYICRKCLGLIKKRCCLKQKLEELEKDLLSEYRSQCHQRGIRLKVESPSKRWTPDVDKPMGQPVYWGTVRPIRQVALPFYALTKGIRHLKLILSPSQSHCLECLQSLASIEK